MIGFIRCFFLYFTKFIQKNGWHNEHCKYYLYLCVVFILITSL